EPNPQTGGAVTIELPKDAVKAENTIYHNRTFASRIIAPVVRTSSQAAAGSAIHHVAGEKATNTTAAVLVGDVPLVHTTQLVAPAGGDAYSQFRQLFPRLEQVLRNAGSDLRRVVKLNIYAATIDDARLAQMEIARQFRSGE